MIALPSDIARGGVEAQKSFQQLLEAMVWLFESTMDQESGNIQSRALSVSALCVGGMVLARALPNSTLAQEVRMSARQTASNLLNQHSAQ